MRAQQDPGVGEIDVRLSPMRRRHLRRVLRIENQVYPRPWSLGLYMNEMALSSSRIYLIATVRSSIAGYGGLMFAAADAHVTTIAVDPAMQGRRIGTRLLLELARQAIDRGAANLTLEVRVSNEPAQRLYRAFGFAPAGVRKNYYSDVGEDALVMWATDVCEQVYVDRLDRIELALTANATPEQRR